MYDGICLAAAGIDRLQWRHRVNIWLEKPEMLYAISQGTDVLAGQLIESELHFPKFLEIVSSLFSFYSFLATLLFMSRITDL